MVWFYSDEYQTEDSNDYTCSTHTLVTDLGTCMRVAVFGVCVCVHACTCVFHQHLFERRVKEGQVTNPSLPQPLHPLEVSIHTSVHVHVSM